MSIKILCSEKTCVKSTIIDQRCVECPNFWKGSCPNRKDIKSLTGKSEIKTKHTSDKDMWISCLSCEFFVGLLGWKKKEEIVNETS